jgi:hypothetical protein
MIGSAETAMTSGNVTPEALTAFKSLAQKKSSSKNYIYLKAGMIEASNNIETAQTTLAEVGGTLGELADSLSYDLGNKDISTEAYIINGAMKPLWYYRAVIAAEGDKKAKLMEEFGSKYPDSALYELVKRWES